MPLIYRFNKNSRDEVYDYETSYCFKVPCDGWVHLNRKATKLIEHDDHFEVILADWYVNNPDGKYIIESVKRRDKCEKIQRVYEVAKELENDRKNKTKD